MKCLFWAVSKLRRIINYLNCRNVENYIIKNNPDVIITTHFLPVEVISSLKRKRRFKGKLITVVTDFGLHSFWVSKEVDRYVVATELTKRDLLERGISENRIDVLGIPIRSVFVTKKDKRELLSKLGAKEGVFTILIAGGGFGAGPVGILFKNLAGLKYDKQLFVVCGTNTRLQGALETAAKDFPNICKIFGFVENMDELMRVSDILIGKSGGLTCSEALALGTPMIIVSPIPGQEARNTKILVKCGAAIELKNLSDINELVERIILNKEILKNLSENSKSLARPEAARDIANLTLSL
ncbi:MAG: glycosyltransferase, partial [Candidatus Omnitrophica bacterium]|nr:glycosyltransferase [Candidatus Omnitrophota bacterium]